MKGFSLIEVLVAAAILTLGILSIAAMQFTALQRSQDAYFRSVATNQILNLLEQYAVGDLDCTTWQTTTTKLLPHAMAKCNRASIAVCWTGRSTQQECIRQKL